MGKLRVHNFSISLDGYGAGPEQTPDNPLGIGGESLHDWFVVTKYFNEHNGHEGGTEGLDHDIASRDGVGLGATIMGRNMFGPIRGPWPDETWTGWWGDNPPYHHPTFVLTHHSRPSVTMEGGTVFHFVTDGPEAALERALDAADGADVRLAGGASTIQQYMRAGLIDEMNFAISPMFLGGGERLFDNLDGGPTGYDIAEMVSSDAATHVRLVRREAGNAAEDSAQ